MKIFLRFTLLFIFSINLTGGYVFSQVSFESEDDLIAQANKLFVASDYVNAMPLFSQLLSLHPADENYNYKFGVCVLHNDEDKTKSLKYFDVAVKGANPDKEAFFYAGRGYHMNAEFDKALSFYEKYKSKAGGTDPLDADRYIEQCRNGKNLYNKNVKLEPLASSETLEREFYRNYDLKAMKGRIIPKPLNFKSKQDKKVDDNTLIFVGTENQSIVYSGYDDDSENKSRELYRVNKLPNGEWSLPQNLGTEINTKYDEEFAFLNSDGVTLYFSSKGHNTMGGYDIFRSVFDEGTGKWSKPVNLAHPINSPDDDIFYASDAEETFAYFATKNFTKPGKIKVYKIGTAGVEQASQPLLIKGKFNINGEHVYTKAEIKITEKATGSHAGTFNSNRKNGNYLLLLEPGKTYVLDITPEDFVSHRLELAVPAKVTEEFFEQKINLQKDATGETMIVTNWFDTGGKTAGTNIRSVLLNEQLAEKAAAQNKKVLGVDELTAYKAQKSEEETKHDNAQKKALAEIESNQQEAQLRAQAEKKAAEEAKAKSEREAAAKIEAEKKAVEDAKLKAEEEKRKADELAKAKADEEKRIAEEKAKAEEELQAEAEAEKKVAEDAKLKVEEEKRKADELAKAKAEEEKFIAEEKAKAEKELLSKAEAEKKAVEDVKQKAEEEKRKADELAKVKADEEKIAAEKAKAEQELAAKLEQEKKIAEAAKAKELEEQRLADEKQKAAELANAEQEKLKAEEAEREKVEAEEHEARRVAGIDATILEKERRLKELLEKGKAQNVDVQTSRVFTSPADSLSAEQTAATKKLEQEKEKAAKIIAEQLKKDEELRKEQARKDSITQVQFLAEKAATEKAQKEKDEKDRKAIEEQRLKEKEAALEIEKKNKAVMDSIALAQAEKEKQFNSWLDSVDRAEKKQKQDLAEKQKEAELQRLQAEKLKAEMEAVEQQAMEQKRNEKSQQEKEELEREKEKLLANIEEQKRLIEQAKQQEKEMEKVQEAMAKTQEKEQRVEKIAEEITAGTNEVKSETNDVVTEKAQVSRERVKAEADVAKIEKAEPKVVAEKLTKKQEVAVVENTPKVETIINLNETEQQRKLRMLLERMNAEAKGREIVEENLKAQQASGNKDMATTQRYKEVVTNKEPVVVHKKEEKIRPPFDKTDLLVHRGVIYKLDVKLPPVKVPAEISELLKPGTEPAGETVYISSGAYQTLAQATIERNELGYHGFSASIIAYLNGQEISISEAKLQPVVD